MGTASNYNGYATSNEGRRNLIDRIESQRFPICFQDGLYAASSLGRFAIARGRDRRVQGRQLLDLVDVIVFVHDFIGDH